MARACSPRYSVTEAIQGQPGQQGEISGGKGREAPPSKERRRGEKKADNSWLKYLSQETEKEHQIKILKRRK